MLPPDVRDDIMGVFYRPPCPKCKTKTMLARITLGSSGFDIRTFKMPGLRSRSPARGQPCRSDEIAGNYRLDVGRIASANVGPPVVVGAAGISARWAETTPNGRDFLSRKGGFQ